MTNAELITRLRTLSEQVPEGEWIKVTATGQCYHIERAWHPATRGELEFALVNSESEARLACLLRNALPQILEALEQVEGENQCEKS